MGIRRDPTRAGRGAIAYVGRGGRKPKVLAHGGYGSRHLALDDRYLYWSDTRAGEITRINKAGGIPVVLAEVPAPKGVCVVDGTLYWLQHHAGSGTRWDPSTGCLMRMAVEGGSKELLLTGLLGAERVAVSGPDLAVTCYGDVNYEGEKPQGLVVRATIGDPQTQVVATGQRWPQSVLFVDDALYWLNHGLKRPNYFGDGALMRTTRAPGRKRWVVHKDQSMASGLIADAESLYWTTAATIFEPLRNGTLCKRPRRGGKTEILVEWGQEGGDLAHDATHLYWMSHDRGSLYRVRKSGGDPELMMTNEDSITISDGLVVDDRCVYWSVHSPDSAGGAVWSIGKEPPGTPAPTEAPLGS